MTSLDDYDYDLPPQLIAQRPSATRTDACLMVVNRRSQTIEHYHIRDLPKFLRPRDCLVLNNTKVIPAALRGYETHGGPLEWAIPIGRQSGHWRIVCKTRGRLFSGETIILTDRELRDRLQLTLLTRLEDGEWAARPSSDAPHLELLQPAWDVSLTALHSQGADGGCRLGFLPDHLRNTRVRSPRRQPACISLRNCSTGSAKPATP